MIKRSINQIINKYQIINKSKKAAVTEFIIIGLIILIVFIFLLYVRQSIDEDESPQRRILESKLRSKTFEFYVQSCLRTSLEQSIDELGASGGYRLIQSPAPSGGRSFLLVPNKDNLPVPHYPCKNFDCKLFYDPDVSCSNQLNNCHFIIDPPLFQSFLLNLDGKDSITLQLKQLVEKKVSECVDIESPEPQFLPYTISKGTPKVEISHETQSLFLDLNFPFTLNTESGDETQTIYYQLTVPTRLRLFYTFLRELLYRDSSDLDFKIDEDFTKMTTYFSGFNVTVDRSSYGLNDLIKVTDAYPSNIEFYFLRQNLAPSLNYISYSADLSNDIVINRGDNVNIPLFAYDPNEDNLSFTVAQNRFAVLEGDHIKINAASPGTYTFKVSASDGNLEDYQEVRILVR